MHCVVFVPCLCTRGARMFACWCTRACVLVSMPPVQMEPKCSWSQCRQKKGRPGEGKGCSLLGGYLQTRTPRQPLDPAHGRPGPWGSEGCAEASEALGRPGRRTALLCLLTARGVQDPLPAAHLRASRCRHGKGQHSLTCGAEARAPAGTAGCVFRPQGLLAPCPWAMLALGMCSLSGVSARTR